MYFLDLYLLNQIKYCLEIWGTDYDKIKQTCLLVEKLGYYGFFYGESLTNLDLDCWTVLSTLVPITKTIRLGPVITYILPNYRSIPLLAKQSISFQDISAGRLELRTGSGATLQYASSWWHPYGIDYPIASKRISIFEECIQLLLKYFGKSNVLKNEENSSRFARDLFTILENNTDWEAVYHNGKFHKEVGSIMIKPKINIPITIAAKSKRMMKIAARYADIWECSYLSPTEFSLKNSQFSEILKFKNESSLGLHKSSNHIKRSMELDVIIADSDQELEYKKKNLALERGPGASNHITSKGLVGTPIDVKTKVNEYINRGIDQFFLAFQDPFDEKSIELFINTVNRI